MSFRSRLIALVSLGLLAAAPLIAQPERRQQGEMLIAQSKWSEAAALFGELTRMPATRRPGPLSVWPI